MTSLQIVRNGLTGGRRGGLRWLPDTCWRQDRDGATVSPGPLVPQQRVPCGRRRAGSRGGDTHGGQHPLDGCSLFFFLGCLAQDPPRNELTPVAGAQPEGMAPMLEGGSQLRGSPGCPGGRCDAGTMLAARGALGGWHPALRLVPMGGGGHGVLGTCWGTLWWPQEDWGAEPGPFGVPAVGRGWPCPT